MPARGAADVRRACAAQSDRREDELARGAADRGETMETGLAVLFGVCCSITDCKRQKIALSVLLAGTAAGVILSGIRVWRGTESVLEIVVAILPAVCLEIVVVLTAGKVGSGDAGLLLVFGLLMGWKACVSIFSMGCLLIGVTAGCGMGIGRLNQNSRLPFAPFLCAATVITYLLQRCG